MCGKFKCGNDHLKLNTPLIFSITLETVDFALSSFDENAFGEYRIVKMSKKTLKSTPIMNSDGHTIDGYKHPVFCGDLKEAITLFDRNVLTIDLNDKGAGLWDKDMTGLKVRDRFDVQAVDKDAVIKGEITEVVNG